MPTSPAGTAELARRGIRGLAVGAVLLAVAAVTATAEGPDGLRPGVLGVGAGVLLLAGTARGLRGRWRSASASSAVVAGVVLATLATRSLLGVEDARLAAFLGAAGAVSLTLGLVADERRLTALGIGQWALALALPGPDASVFRHCLVATELRLPVPRLDGPLLLGLGAVAAGTALRWWGRRLRAARGVEVTGLLLVLGGLLAKGAELPGLAVLCGTGDATDAGWLALALAAGLGATTYGLTTADAAWAAAGVTAVVLSGLLGTALGAGAGWAVAALVPVAAAVAACELRGVPWPDHPGYGSRRPRDGDLDRSRG